MIKTITRAYVGLLFIFGLVLVIGSVKSTVYPDEMVYSAGKVVALYDKDNDEFVQLYNKPASIKANVFEVELEPVPNHNDCEK